MWRTELIPQTTAAINKGTVFYHFSMKRGTTNVPSATNEHQINFFESHFTEMKYGWVSGEQGTSNTNLQWFVGGQSKWKVELAADVWHNVAYEIVRLRLHTSFNHATNMFRRTSPLVKSPSGTPPAPTRSPRRPVHSLLAPLLTVLTGIWVFSVCLARATMARVPKTGSSAVFTSRLGL